MTPAEEMLARLGTPTCDFCGKLRRGPERNSFIHGRNFNDDPVSGVSCSDLCERTALNKQRAWLAATKVRRIRDDDALYRAYEDLLKSFYDPSSSEYRQAQNEHRDDLNEAMNSWSIGNGLFGPIKD